MPVLRWLTGAATPWTRLLALLPVLAVLAAAPNAQAAFPGANGRIAFSSSNGIELINPDGTDRVVVPGTSGARRPAWSPSGSLIAFNQSVSGGAIWVVHPDGSDLQKVTSDGGTPNWSPDGERLVFHSSVDGNSEIYSVRLDGTDRQRLTTNAAVDGSPVWSPDGTRIAFVSDRSGDYQVWTIPAAGGPASQLSHIGDVEDRPSWRPDGSQIAYTVDPGDFVDLFVAGANGGDEHRITFAGNDFAQSPAFSPDGTRIAYRRAGALWTDSAGGGNPAQIPNTDDSDDPDWGPVTMPIVFIHGFLGSRVKCNGSEVWPSIPASLPDPLAMQLAPDGVTDASGSCEVPSGLPGLIQVAGGDIYGSTVDYLKKIAPSNYHVFSWDWRKSPEQSLQKLDDFIDQVRPVNGKVVLMAHSMGGLVTRWYIDDPSRAKKVDRAVTVGTPYWGAPKAVFPLAAGISTPDFDPIDILFNNSQLQHFARNLQGLYFLWPSASFGSWLSVGSPPQPLNNQGTFKFMASLGGNPTLLANAQIGHTQHLNQLNTNDVDYQVMLGTGLNTIGKVQIAPLMNGDALYNVQWVSGDQTVPRESARMGGAPGARLHSVCGISHVPLPGSQAVDDRIKDFLLSGKPISGEDCDNPASGFQVTTQHLYTQGPELAARTSAASGALTPSQAHAQGLIELLNTPAQSIIATNSTSPVTLALRGKRHLAVKITPLSDGKKGKPRFYKPVEGTVTLEAGEQAVLKKGKKKLKPLKHPDNKPPRTRALVKLDGGHATIRFEAKDKSGVEATYVKVGKLGRTVHGKLKVKVKRSRLRTLRFQSIDVFGNVEKPRRLKPHH